MRGRKYSVWGCSRNPNVHSGLSRAARRRRATRIQGIPCFCLRLRCTARCLLETLFALGAAAGAASGWRHTSAEARFELLLLFVSPGKALLRICTTWVCALQTSDPDVGGLITLRLFGYCRRLLRRRSFGYRLVLRLRPAMPAPLLTPCSFRCPHEGLVAKRMDTVVSAMALTGGGGLSSMRQGGGGTIARTRVQCR